MRAYFFDLQIKEVFGIGYRFPLKQGPAAERAELKVRVILGIGRE